MVRPRDIIANRLWRHPPQKDRPGMADTGEQRLRRWHVHRQLQMFGRERVDDGRGIAKAGDKDDCAMRVPTGARGGRGCQSGDDCRDLRCHCVGKTRIIADQDRLAGRVMFGLGEEVGCNPSGVIGHVRHHQYFGWPGHHVDADPPEQLPFRLCHPGVAGAGDDIDRRDRRCAMGERGNRLRAADAPNLCRAAKRCGGKDKLVGHPAGCRRHHHAAFDPCDARGD